MLLCDEPTGALDWENSQKILNYLVKINEKYQTTIIIVTHNLEIAKVGDRVIKMNSGTITSDRKNKRVSPLKI